MYDYGLIYQDLEKKMKYQRAFGEDLSYYTPFSINFFEALFERLSTLFFGLIYVVGLASVLLPLYLREMFLPQVPEFLPALMAFVMLIFVLSFFGDLPQKYSLKHHELVFFHLRKTSEIIRNADKIDETKGILKYVVDLIDLEGGIHKDLIFSRDTIQKLEHLKKVLGTMASKIEKFDKKAMQSFNQSLNLLAERYYEGQIEVVHKLSVDLESGLGGLEKFEDPSSFDTLREILSKIWVKGVISILASAMFTIYIPRYALGIDLMSSELTAAVALFIGMIWVFWKLLDSFNAGTKIVIKSSDNKG